MGEYITFTYSNKTPKTSKVDNIQQALSNKLPIFEVWREGYCCSDGDDGARFVGYVEGLDFKSALSSNEDFLKRHKIYLSGGDYVIWGCRLYDNSGDASKSFGPPSKEALKDFKNRKLKLDVQFNTRSL